MPKLGIGMPTSRGFTLIEILIVLFIIGITLSFALMAFGDFGEGRKLKGATERLSAYIKLVQQRAILEMNSFRLDINDEGYKTFRFSHNAWQMMSAKTIFHETHFPKAIRVRFTNPTKTNQAKSSIIIHPTGDLTPFKLQLTAKSGADTFSLEGKPNGQLVLKTIK